MALYVQYLDNHSLILQCSNLPYFILPLNLLWLAQPHRSCLLYGQCLSSRSVIHSRFGIRCNILCIWVVFLLTRTHFIATATTSTNSTAGWLTTSGSHFQLAGTSCFIVGSQGVLLHLLDGLWQVFGTAPCSSVGYPVFYFKSFIRLLDLTSDK